LRVTLAGCLLDSLLGALGVFSFAQWPLPGWLALLWLVLASGLRHSLAWAMRPAWRGVLLGALAARRPIWPVRSLRASACRWALATALLLAPLWALALPLALRLAAWR
jgi:hypothetical protein